MRREGKMRCLNSPPSLSAPAGSSLSTAPWRAREQGTCGTSCSSEGRGWTGGRRKASAHVSFGEWLSLNREWLLIMSFILHAPTLVYYTPDVSWLRFMASVCFSATLWPTLLLYVLHLNSSREYLMVLPSNIGQGTHRAACEGCAWVTHMPLVQLAAKQDGLWWKISQNCLWGADPSEDTVWLEPNLHV